MSDLFDAAAITQVRERLNKLNPDAAPLWGKMNASQMVKHCQAPFQVYFGDMQMKRNLIGILFGGMAKRRMFSPKPWSKGLPTAPEFIVRETPDFVPERETLISQIERFSASNPDAKVPKHPFFGNMSPREWAVLGYKHLDHHLKQFGV